MPEPDADETASAPPGAAVTYRIYGWLFPRALAVIYAIAFASWSWQAEALTGEKGLLPVPKFLEAAGAYAERENVHAWLEFPTIYWLGFSDSGAQWLCQGGIAVAVLVLCGVLQGPFLLALWFGYLSICTTSDVFMGYQWDALLLEAGLIAVLLAPWRLLSWRMHDRLPSPTRVEALLPQALVFKLMLLSGILKLASGDPNWWNLTALRYHYETQPIPTWLAWHAHQLPLWCHQVSCFLMFVVELGMPVLMLVALAWEWLAPGWTRTLRVMKLTVAGSFTGLMLVTLLTGNYTYFNWLTILLSLSVLDDACWPAFLKRWLRWSPEMPAPSYWMLSLRHGVVACLLGAGLLVELETNVLVPGKWAEGVREVLKPLAPFRSVNSYGLFRVMTTERNEIIIEVSDDGAYYQPLEFRWKPGRLDRAPPFVAPHQPRLDWQMWFAAFHPGFLPERDAQQGRMVWFGALLSALLEHNARVYALLEPPPFPVESIRYVRTRLVQYHFTDATARKETGEWWTGSLLGNFSQVFRGR